MERVATEPPGLFHRPVQKLGGEAMSAPFRQRGHVDDVEGFSQPQGVLQAVSQNAGGRLAFGRNDTEKTIAVRPQNSVDDADHLSSFIFRP